MATPHGCENAIGAAQSLRSPLCRSPSFLLGLVLPLEAMARAKGAMLRHTTSLTGNAEWAAKLGFDDMQAEGNHAHPS